MECSICIATYNKAVWLQKTLESIVCQNPPFEWEIIVVNDGSSDNTKEICNQFSKVKYIQIDRDPIFRNPGLARNVAYKEATGRVLICQSDEVLHVKENTIERLVTELLPKTFSIATVWNTDKNGNHKGLEQWPKIVQLTGPRFKRPFFFLGAILRKDMYAVGGNDESYVGPGREDQALGDTLIHGLGLVPRYADVEGHHVEHPRPFNLNKLCQPNAIRYKSWRIRCIHGRSSWISSKPWEYKE